MAVLEPELVEVEQFNVTGLSVRTKNEDEFNPQTAKLQQLWNQFFTVEIPNRKATSAIYGVYSNYESDYNGFYTVTAGVEVSVPVPDSKFVTTVVNKGSYLVFKNSGPIPQIIYETWEAIWSYFKAHPEVIRAYDTDFEMSSGPESCAIYIGVTR